MLWYLRKKKENKGAKCCIITILLLFYCYYSLTTQKWNDSQVQVDVDFLLEEIHIHAPFTTTWGELTDSIPCKTFYSLAAVQTNI